MKKLIFILAITLFMQVSVFAKYVRDHNREIVTDTDSGLMWQDSRLKHSGWKDSLDYCSDLKLGEFSDWRLPNFNELFYLADKSKSQPAISDVFKNIPTRNYWTSTAHNKYKRRDPIVWNIHFGPGTASWEHEINDYYIRCVRNTTKKINFSSLKTGQTKSIFEKDDGKLQNGISRHFTRDDKKNIVTDDITKLQWQDDEVNIVLEKKWLEAKEYCEKINFSGYDDWRLPQIDELVSITNKNKHKNTTYNVFKKSKSTYYWTSSTYVQNEPTAWVVNFKGGASFSQAKEHSLNLRCVRGGDKNLSEVNNKNTSKQNLRYKVKLIDEKNDKALNKKLYNAAKDNDIKLVKVLIDQGAYVNTTQYSSGQSVLNSAVINKNFEMVKLLVEKGANINYDGDSDVTALMYSTKNSDTKIMKYLLKHGADINKSGMNGSALFFALSTNTPDNYIKMSKNIKIADYLISKGINLNLTNDDKESALISALSFGNTQAFKYLIKKGADINQRNKEGQNILFYLIQSYNSECEKCSLTLELMQYAIDNKIDINSPDKHIRTPLHIAVLFQRNKLIKILVENGASLNIKDSRGETPLYFSIDNDDFNTTKYLVEKGAKIDIKSYDDTTLYDYALERKNLEIIEFLKSKK